MGQRPGARDGGKGLRAAGRWNGMEGWRLAGRRTTRQREGGRWDDRAVIETGGDGGIGGLAAPAGDFDE